MKATKQQSIRRGVIAAVVGAGAVALIAPVIASGGAVNSVGSGSTLHQFTTQMTGANEFPTAGDPDGAGSATITVDTATGEICADLRVSAIGTVTAAHIHPGAAGTANPPAVTLNNPTPTSATCVIDAVNAPLIVATPANFYVNVHTSDYLNGAIRGQLAASTALKGTTQLLAEPVRVYDSREGTVGPLAQGETRVISLTSGKNGAGATVPALPAGATAAMVRLTLDNTVTAGFVKLYSNALTAQPATSAANWFQTDSIVGADATVAVDAEGKVKVTGGVNSTDIVIDVVGYLF
jgi:hypothetical protein